MFLVVLHLGGAVAITVIGCVCLKCQMFISFSALSFRCWVKSENDTIVKQAYQCLIAGVELCGENT